MAVFKGKNDLRCPVCLLEWNLAAMQAAGVIGCPSCHTKIQPLKISEDGYIKINWQDLRVLAIYAQRWSITFDLQNGGNRDALRALQNILNNLRNYQPRNAQPLTPPFDAIIVKGGPPMRGAPIDLFEGELVVDEFTHVTADMLKPDHTGMIPSPFFKKRKP